MIKLGLAWRVGLVIALCSVLAVGLSGYYAYQASRRLLVAGAEARLQTATGVCGSIVVALALLEGRLSAEEAFEVSQLDETYQIEQWGEDAEATKRRANVRAEIVACRRFVDLLRG